MSEQPDKTTVRLLANALQQMVFITLQARSAEEAGFANPCIHLIDVAMLWGTRPIALSLLRRCLHYGVAEYALDESPVNNPGLELLLQKDPKREGKLTASIIGRHQYGRYPKTVPKMVEILRTFGF